mgnify:FL=1
MDFTYIIYGENIYYLDENNVIFSIEGFHGVVREGFKKSSFIKPFLVLNNNSFIEGATPEEIAEQTLSKTALHEKYPEVIGMNWQLLQLDSLPGIQRMEPTSNKGLKGIKKYQKDGVLIWSIGSCPPFWIHCINSHCLFTPT